MILGHRTRLRRARKLTLTFEIVCQSAVQILMLIIQCQVSMLYIEQLWFASSSIQLMQSSQCKLADLTTKDQNQNQIGNPSQRDKIDFQKLSQAWMHFAPFLWAEILAAQTLISCHILIRRGKYYFTKWFIVIEEQIWRRRTVTILSV